MPRPNHVNPDHFLYAPDGGDVTAARAKEAWDRAWQELQRQIEATGPAGTLYLVCGLQGAGKSTWVTRHAHEFEPSAVFFDAALPSRRHRARALGLAAGAGMPAVAVWLKVPLEVALQRNAGRPPREQVPEHVVRHVLDQLEPPSVDEGFVRVIEVDATAG